MNNLLDIGFQPAGHWFLVEEKLKFEITRHATQANILYAFICDAEVMYVGKTIRTLASRMAGYKTPARTQTTNIHNNQKILELLKRGVAIEIWALPDNGLLHYGRFHINLAAALEDDIIRKLNPPWNGGKAEKVIDAEIESQNVLQEFTTTSAETFSFILQPTYYRSGFFNVGVSSQKHIGADSETIEIFLGDATSPILGTINRRANTNGTPRIMGGPAVRNWFHMVARSMDRIGVQVLSPTSIRLSINS